MAAQSYGGASLSSTKHQFLAALIFIKIIYSESTQESRSNYLRACATSHLNALESALASNAMREAMLLVAQDSPYALASYADSDCCFNAVDDANKASNLGDIFEVQGLLVIERYQLTVVKSFTPLTLFTTM